MDAKNSDGTYGPNSQDVLIPAFIAAYTGKNPDDQDLHAFPEIPLPNWSVTYTGLSKLEIFKEVFRSVKLSHAYASEYSVGNYTSSLLYDPAYLGLDVSLQDVPLPIVNPETGELVPVFVTDQITITESFRPLIGLDISTTGNLRLGFKYNRNRSMVLNLSNAQITEVKNTDITFDAGWTKTGLKVPFKVGGKQRVLKNDLTFRMAFTLRDNVDGPTQN